MKLRAKRMHKNNKEYTIYEITLPKDLIEALKWKPGTQLDYKIVDINHKKAIAIYPKD